MVLGLWFESVRVMFFLCYYSNALPVPMLRQVFQNMCFTCMGAPFWSNMARHLQRPFWDYFWLHFGIILESLLKLFGWYFGDVSESWFEVGFLVFST